MTSLQIETENRQWVEFSIFSHQTRVLHPSNKGLGFLFINGLSFKILKLVGFGNSALIYV